MQDAANDLVNDLTNLQKILESTGVTVFRPMVESLANMSLPPPRAPAHHLVMLGNIFYESHSHHGPFISSNHMMKNCNVDARYQHIFEHILEQGNSIIKTSNDYVNSACTIQLPGKVLQSSAKNKLDIDQLVISFYQSRHLDQCMCIPVPGLIISARDPNNPGLLNKFYKTYFPDWEIFYLDSYSETAPSIIDWQMGNHRSNDIDRYVAETNPQRQNWASPVTISNMYVLGGSKLLIGFRHQELETCLDRHKVTAIHCSLKRQSMFHVALGCLLVAINRKP